VKKDFTVDVMLNGKPFSMELDTGNNFKGNISLSFSKCRFTTFQLHAYSGVGLAISYQQYITT